MRRNARLGARLTAGAGGFRGLEELEGRRLLTSAAFDLMGLTAARADPVFSDIDGSGVSVAVIDTGLDSTHPLLAPNYVAGFNFIDSTSTPTDNEGHGTHVSGIIGATSPDIGVANKVGLIGLRVFQDNGGATGTTISQALEWVLAHRAQYNIVAVNMSLGSGFYTSADQAASGIYVDDIRRLEAAGVTVVSAAGNSYKGHETQNAASPGIVSTLDVGAVWQDGVHTNEQWQSGAIDYTTGPDRIVSFSQRIVAANTVFAPGALILSTYKNGGMAQEAGTSMAAPMVAGSVALLQEAALKFGGRLLTPEEVRTFIVTNADTIIDGDDENDNVVNTGLPYPRINVHKALRALKTFFNAAGGGQDNNGNTGDVNGTLEGAVRVPGPLNGRNDFAIAGTVGADGAGSSVSGKDVDLYTFTIADPGTVTITTATNAGSPLNFDSYLRLFDASGNELAFDDNSGGGGFARLSVVLPKGTYFAGVSGAPNTGYDPTVVASGVAGATGNYALTVAFTNADTSGTISGAEDSNLGTLTKPFTIDGRIGEDNGVATDRADVDFFRLTVPDDGTLLIDIDTAWDTDYVDTYLRVFDENGNEFSANDNALSFDFKGNDDEYADGPMVKRVGTNALEGHTTDSFVGGTVNRGDVYLIGVSHSGNKTYDPNDLSSRPASGPGGRYRLIVQFVNNDLNGAIPQAVDSSVIPLPITDQPGIIGADGIPGGGTQQVGDRDVDFIKLAPTQDGVLEIQIDSYGISINNPVDTVLYLYDADGNLLASADDSDGTLDPHVLYSVKAGVVYYAAVAGYGNEGFDPFQLGSGTTGDTGNYSFTSRLLATSARADYIDDVVGDGGVRTINTGDSVDDSIGADDDFQIGASDVDIFTFVPSQTGVFVFRTDTSATFSADTVLRLFDSAGHELYYNDNAAADTTASTLTASLTAGGTYYLTVSGASANARKYDPFTGAGAAPGSAGDYTVTLAQESGTGTGRFASAPDAVESVAAGPTGRTVVATRSASGRPLEFEQQPGGSWSVVDVTEKTGGPPISGDVRTWVDPKDGITYAVSRGSTGVLLYTHAPAGWTVRDLTAEIGGAVAGSGFTVFIDKSSIVNVAALSASGDVLLYAQTGAVSGGAYAWRFQNLSQQIRDVGLTPPVYAGGLVSYVTSWNGLNIAGLDAQGQVQAVWWAPTLTVWTTSNLSQITGAPTLVGGLTAYVTSYDAVNIVGADASGHLVTTWWVPSFGGNWVKSDLTQLYSGPKLQASTVASYVTPWDGTNIAGIQADGTVTIYWWAPGMGGTWAITPISTFIQGATRMVGSVQGATSVTGVINLVGASADGDVLRYFWTPSSNTWAQEDLTQTAIPG